MITGIFSRLIIFERFLYFSFQTGKGPFPCPECPQEFERVHDLARHLPRDHRIDTGFKLSHFEKCKFRLFCVTFIHTSWADSRFLTIPLQPLTIHLTGTNLVVPAVPSE